MINMNVPVDELCLSVRSTACLANSDIKTIWQLVNTSDATLLRMPNFGKKSLKEVREEVERWKSEQIAWGQPPVLPPPNYEQDIRELLKEQNRLLRMLATDATVRELVELNHSFKVFLEVLRLNGYVWGPAADDASKSRTLR